MLLLGTQELEDEMTELILPFSRPLVAERPGASLRVATKALAKIAEKD